MLAASPASGTRLICVHAGLASRLDAVYCSGFFHIDTGQFVSQVLFQQPLGLHFWVFVGLVLARLEPEKQREIDPPVVVPCAVLEEGISRQARDYSQLVCVPGLKVVGTPRWNRSE